MTRTEIRDWLLENAVDDAGDLILNGLDFSDFEGDVYIGFMKVKGNLSQGNQNVNGDLMQSYQNVNGDLYQGYQKAKGNLFQYANKYGGKLYDEPATKLLKKITKKELAELGYTL